MNLLNPSHRQFLDLPLRGKLHFLSYLLSASRRNASDDSDGNLILKGWKRNHHQLPCTSETRMRRAQLFLSLGFQHKSICLLGDDDLVAIELMKLGFTRVTVYDCDAKVLNQIEEAIPKHCRPFLELKQMDFHCPIGLRFHFADLVCFDPPYNREGLELFLKTALACSKQDEGSKLIMMTIPILFQNKRDDWATVERNLQKGGFLSSETHPNFNSYPLDFFSRFCLFCLSRPYYRQSLTLGEIRFFSDCLVWDYRRSKSSSSLAFPEEIP
ncbi:MAG TPA: bis-aminopropyl spermidine synthase family protein [Oligoflexus sp.]|uniref:bis-aminopropyl spermidine synthase family protein n=1 Tax=Oligoflexus sp. TaxID=1971216 RepID=UPI002D7F5BFB|nr:bis-aminopropyl spermidine synthase family protein [Oligoflexus sp.]HET9236224.1 bis-aminopropyl spermidine synthase family protein [Oligoflexus sp.]